VKSSAPVQLLPPPCRINVIRAPSSLLGSKMPAAAILPVTLHSL